MGAVARLLGALPALPLHEAGKYVAGAYVVVFALVLTYVAIMGVRLSRIERELGDLLSSERARGAEEQASPHAESTLR
jgi:CcmD family protein